jgi:uncharacterized protein
MAYSKEIIDAADRLNIRPEAVQTYLNAGLSRSQRGAERRFHCTIKPIGSACNLHCAYCYYLGKEKLLGQSGDRRMENDTLERFIVDYIESQDTEEIVFTWHGGEPTLLGLPFFRSVVDLQIKHRPEGRRISNDIQTNGTLLDEEWCSFFAANGFLVGLSLDGPRGLHDAYRTTREDGPSFDRVLAAARLLASHGVTFSTLSTVSFATAKRPVEVYRFLRDEVATPYLQFTPCVETRQYSSVPPDRLDKDQLVSADDPRSRPDHPDSVVTPWSVDPDDWGDFLVGVFDEWHANDRGRVRVNLFENMFAQVRGEPAIVCSNAPICGKNIAVESDGGVYACDHFVYPEHRLGTVGDASLAGMVFSLKQLEFGLNKFNSLSAECRSCAFLKLCWGDCPRTRIFKASGGGGPKSYLCKGWKKFFRQRLTCLTAR